MPPLRLTAPPAHFLARQPTRARLTPASLQLSLQLSLSLSLPRSPRRASTKSAVAVPGADKNKQRPKWVQLSREAHAILQTVRFQKDAAALGPLTAVGAQAAGVSLQFKKAPKPIEVSKIWLRDSCQCEHCVSPSSGQKRFSTVDLPENPTIRKGAIRIDEDGSLEIKWEEGPLLGPDGSHTSVYTAEFLAESLAGAMPLHPSSSPRQLWDRRRLEKNLKVVKYADWMASGDEFWQGLKALWQFGIVVVDGVPHSETSVRDIAQQIGPIQNTFYGETWDVVSKPAAENVAYTSEFLGLHQDLMYMRDPPFIQALHCLQNECEGGESLFSDGIRAAVETGLKHPEYVQVLSTFNVRYHYDRNGNKYHYSRPVIGLPDRGPLVSRVSWAPPFQDVMRRVPATVGSLAETFDKFYLHQWKKAGKWFSDLLQQPENMYEFKLRPGQCVLFDNSRLLHGRRQFQTGGSGHRWLKGTYVGEQVFLSKLAQLPGQWDRLQHPSALRDEHESRKQQVQAMLEGKDPDDLAPPPEAGESEPDYAEKPGKVVEGKHL